ncbi:sulfite exporter TauE/SafE family protein [Streptomyces sp. NBC_00006]|uniref:sulfite exporter TauE/SafE family protein n=1 Tax=Streptomyces sp. NBC_00006 TaxID=2975619 RepID=UPI00225209B0|nr:sulfite exporter TauE/SafE family protein [Streptomyces sp. NBC_00006]MCX5535555.1 sulfite exporter TauE/SafE family protein [Streptomyces sp. NBC_00006]
MNTLILAVLCGAVVGLALGGLGGGGGVLAVPALVYLLGVDPADAGTTSLVIVTVTSATALARHAGTGAVRWRTGVLFAVVGAVPTVGASMLAHRLPQNLLTGAFAVLAGVAAAVMLRGARARGEAPPASTGPPVRAAAGPASAGPPTRPTAGPAPGLVHVRESEATVTTATAPGRAGPLRTAGAGAGLGAVTGLLGVGGGFLAVPTLVSVLRLPMRVAVGTSLVVTLLNSLVSLTTRLTTEGISIDPAVLGPFVGAAILGAWDARRLAAKLSGPALQRAFAVLLLATAAFMLVDAFV